MQDGILRSIIDFSDIFVFSMLIVVDSLSLENNNNNIKKETCEAEFQSVKI